MLEHDGGVLTTFTTTFDLDGAARHGVEVSAATARSSAAIRTRSTARSSCAATQDADEPLELVPTWRDNARGLGLQDLCRAVRDGTPQRASGARGLHVLEVLLAIRASARDGARGRYGACGSFLAPRLVTGAEGGGTTGPMSPSGASSRSTITGA